MPANNKRKSPLAQKPANSKPQGPSKVKPSTKMDSSEPETATWSTGPIMDTDPKPKSAVQSAPVAAHKSYMNNTNTKSAGMKQQKQLSMKQKKRKELATMKAEAFKDQLAAKIERSTARK